MLLFCLGPVEGTLLSQKAVLSVEVTQGLCLPFIFIKMLTTIKYVNAPTAGVFSPLENE